jgi:hypothetical protein
VLKVVHTNETIRASIGGIRVFDDNHHFNRWPTEPSRVGLIATGHSGAEFDDLHVAPRSERR